MNSLFPGELLNINKVGDLKATMSSDSKSFAPEHPMHSWDFAENFPNQIDPDTEEQEGGNLVTLTTPIIAFDEALLISLKENFLKVSPIFSNLIAIELVKLFLNSDNKGLDIIVLGTSDQITEVKSISETTSTLQPPEFITGFIGATLTQLITNNVPFQGIIAPSEGPIGFEKLTLITMEEMIGICSQWSSADREKYKEECYRRWRLNGAAIGTQSGLYI